MVSVHACPMARPGMRFAGGMNVYLKQLAPLLAADGVCVDIFTRSHEAGGPEIIDLGPRARVIHIPAGPPYISKGEVFDYLPEFIQGLKSFTLREGLGYDLVHSHYWFSGWVGRRLAEEWQVPHVVTFHTLSLVKQGASGAEEPPEREETELEMAHSADQIVAFTRGEQQALVDLYGAVPERIQVIPGGVDLTRFQRQDQLSARQRLGFDPTQRIVLYVGRLDAFKGPEVLLRALPEIQSSLQVHFAFVGGGGDADPEAARLQQLARELGVAGNVYWQSAIPQDQLVDYYNAADICAMPSYHESFGLVALESMACGTPVVAAKVGALTSLVLDGQTGCLVNGHDPASFARCLEELLVNDELRQELGRGAQEWARQFPWSRVVRELVDVYSRAMESAGRRPLVAPCAD